MQRVKQRGLNCKYIFQREKERKRERERVRERERASKGR